MNGQRPRLRTQARLLDLEQLRAGSPDGEQPKWTILPGGRGAEQGATDTGATADGVVCELNLQHSIFP